MKEKLAINGAPPVRGAPFAPWPVFGASEEEALMRVLRSREWGTLGPEVESFQESFARYLGVPGSVAVTNGTVALEIILRALELVPGDEVIIPPYTFVATAFSVLMAGGTPVFADILPETALIDPKSISEKLTPKTRAIIPVHMAGTPADMDAIAEIADSRGIPVIEDAAQAHGSQWRGRNVGSLGYAGAFSFQCSKNMSSGEGGAITSGDKNFLDRCWSIHHVGRKRGSRWYEHDYLGGNARMTEWQAAVLSAQLSRLDEQIAFRQRSAEKLNRIITRVTGIESVPVDARVTRNTRHLFMFRYKKEHFAGKSKMAFVRAMNAEGIPVNEGYTPLYSQKAFTSQPVRIITGGRNYHTLRLPGTEKTVSEMVWLPQNVLLSDDQALEDVGLALEKLSGNAGEIPELGDKQ